MRLIVNRHLRLCLLRKRSWRSALPSQTDEFWLGLLHRLRKAIAADRFNVICYNPADSLEGFVVGSRSMRGKHGVIGGTDRVILGQRFLRVYVDTGQETPGQHQLGQGIEVNQVRTA